MSLEVVCVDNVGIISLHIYLYTFIYIFAIPLEDRWLYIPFYQLPVNNKKEISDTLQSIPHIFLISVKFESDRFEKNIGC